ncbi:MAG: putative zinc-binding protein [Smithella sp.]|nr:putative zinc-binding protein [Smithella sp.]
MTCLAGIGAGLTGFIQSAIGTDENITVDGCPIACARNSLERICVIPKSYILTNMGLEKHDTPVTGTIIDEIIERIKKDSGFTAATSPRTGGGCCGT